MVRVRILPLLYCVFALAACAHDSVLGPVPGDPGALVLQPEKNILTIVGESVEVLVERDGVVEPLPVSADQLAWTTSDPHVLRVDPDGVVTAQGQGQATISATDGSSSGTVSVEVSSTGPLGPAVIGRETDCDGAMAGPFPCSSITLLSYLPNGALGVESGRWFNDIWGWTDSASGRAFALVGRRDGVTFVEVTDPTSPRVLGDLPTAALHSRWRDIKVLGHNAFVVADRNTDHGMQIFDLRVLLQTEGFTRFTEHARYSGFSDAHNLAINETTGFAYASGGETCGTGIHMLDLSRPGEPRFAGCFNQAGTGSSSDGYTHDLQCVVYEGPDADYQGREVCFALNETHLVVVDVTDKQSPMAISTATYPGARYVHQGWLTSDQRYFYQDDEQDEGTTTTMIWDVADLDDPIKIAEHLGPSQAVDHNLYIHGNRAYLSNYTAGIRVLDVSNPLAPVEVAFLDTVPDRDDASFDGSWSNFLFRETGVIVATSAEEGLVVFRVSE